MIPKQNDKQNRDVFDHGNHVPVHSAQQNLIGGVHVQQAQRSGQNLRSDISREKHQVFSNKD